MPDRWIEPLGLLTGPAAASAIAAGLALPLHGGPTAFTLARLIGRDPDLVPAAAIPADWRDLLLPLIEAPPPFAGLVPKLGSGAPLVMGVVNVTPDSVSGDGLLAAGLTGEALIEAALAQGQAMLASGADLLDIGGESTRPGAAPVTPEEECHRILPVIQALAPLAPLSVDTRNALTMREALAAGARIVNDVSGLRHDPDAARVVAESGAPLILMHMLGDDPRHMQDDPRYDDVTLDVAAFLATRLAAAEAAGIPRHRIALDPGLGFGKLLEHNLALLHRLPLLAGLGCPLLVGASRKRSIGRLSGATEGGKARMPGSIAAALFAAARGAAILRVHDVTETVQALRVHQAALSGDTPPDGR
ncbi:dihydropteroate synthase [Belnapia moabensis]|uniref:dihydropteroate synthase n=1 Tax=Belnapia moabensis TaxID=365533 RepID=UPI0005BB70EE|nr:dihydropteroate synthase [Belnapia moabensis]